MSLPTQSLLIILCCVAGVLGLWWYEMIVDIGWAGSSWLTTSHWSPYGIVVLVVVAYLTPIGLRFSLPLGKLLMAGIELYLTSLVAYFIARIVLLSLYTNVYGYLHVGGLLGILIVVIFLTAFSYWNITHRRLQSQSSRLVWYVLAGIILSVPLAWVTVFCWNGFGSGRGILDAIKMGYPQAWLTLLLGLSSWMVAKEKQLVRNTQAKNVLDDMSDLR